MRSTISGALLTVVLPGTAEADPLAKAAMPSHVGLDETNALVGAASLVAAIVFGLLAWYLSHVANRAAATANKISIRSTEDQYFGLLTEWASGVVRSLEEAIHLCLVDPKQSPDLFFQRRLELMAALSALLDQGRWFFPNLEDDAHGADNEPAFRGYRQGVLNLIAKSYTLIKSYNFKIQTPNWPIKAALVANERNFVSIIQSIVDPRRREEEFKHLVGSVWQDH